MHLRKQNITSGILIFSIIIIILLVNFFVPPNRIMYLDNKNVIDNLVQDASTNLNEKLAYSEYKRMQDSIRIEIVEDNMSGTGSRTMVSSFGVQDIKKEKENENKKYYITAAGYYVKDYIQFYSKEGQDYLKYFIWEEEDKNGLRTGELKLLPTNLNIEQNIGTDKGEWIIGFPITKNAFTIWNIIIKITLGILALLAFYVLLFIPLRFLLLLAKGEAFSNESIGYLYTISLFLIIVGILDSLITLFTHVYFKSQVPSTFNFFYFNDIMEGWILIVAGLIVLLFTKAFLNGLQLQEEQKLIV